MFLLIRDLKGLVPPEKLELCGLDPAELHRLDRLQDNKNPHFANILKGGIVYSNKVVIMSSSHSSIPGLEPTLEIHKDKLFFAPFGVENSMEKDLCCDLHVSAYTSIKNL